jgi:LysM repeat protein
MDYQSWAKGLKSAGYATNPQYAVILNNIIARYRLGKYDTMVILGDAYGQPQKQGVVMEHGIPAVFAQPGATPKDIAQTHQLGVWQIYRYNDLERGDALRAGEVVYLKPKKRTASVPQHVYRQGESLRDISQKYGIKLKRVYHLNSLEPGEVLPAGTVLQLQKKQQHPVTQQPVFEEQVVEMPRLSEDTAGGLYTVKPGETLFGLAKRWGMEPARLAAINGLSAQAALKAGQLLVLRSDLKPQKTMIEPGTAMDQKKGVHVVMAGETLYSIARMYAVSVDSLRSWNLNLEPLQSGRTLRVSAAGPQKEQAALYYTVQPGDTAFSIAKKFGITLDELRLRNQLTDFQLRPGMQLNIK